MPSIWSLLLSTIVFFVAAWYARRLLIEQDIQKGFTLNVVVLTLATAASFGADKVVGWIGNKIEGKETAVQTSAPAAVGGQSAIRDTAPE